MLYNYKADLIRVIDGDTILVTIDLGFQLFHKCSLRLARINTPEIDSSDEKQRELAAKAKQYVELWFKRNLNTCLLSTARPDKYGRYLADVYDVAKSQCLNSLLVIENLAVLAHG